MAKILEVPLHRIVMMWKEFLFSRVIDTAFGIEYFIPTIVGKATPNIDPVHLLIHEFEPS